MHKAMKQVSADIAARVPAVVLFGDPDDGQPVQGIDAGDVSTFCAKGDLICDGIPLVLIAHLSYAFKAVDAAQFVAGRVQV